MNTATVYHHGLQVSVSYEPPDRRPIRATQIDPPESGELYLESVVIEDMNEWLEYARNGDGVYPMHPVGAERWLRSRPSEMDALWKKVMA